MYSGSLSQLRLTRQCAMLDVHYMARQVRALPPRIEAELQLKLAKQTILAKPKRLDVVYALRINPHPWSATVS